MTSNGDLSLNLIKIFWRPYLPTTRDAIWLIIWLWIDFSVISQLMYHRCRNRLHAFRGVLTSASQAPISLTSKKHTNHTGKKTALDKRLLSSNSFSPNKHTVQFLGALKEKLLISPPKHLCSSQCSVSAAVLGFLLAPSSTSVLDLNQSLSVFFSLVSLSVSHHNLWLFGVRGAANLKYVDWEM